MTLTERLLDLERGFWTGDADFFRSHLTESALMAFPDPVGVLDRDATLEAIAQAPRWRTVELDDAHTVELGDAAVVLTYRATARRAPDEPLYSARGGSCYLRTDDGWRLAYHQQTPL